MLLILLILLSTPDIQLILLASLNLMICLLIGWRRVSYTARALKSIGQSVESEINKPVLGEKSRQQELASFLCSEAEKGTFMDPRVNLKASHKLKELIFLKILNLLFSSDC